MFRLEPAEKEACQAALAALQKREPTVDLSEWVRRACRVAAQRGAAVNPIKRRA